MILILMTLRVRIKIYNCNLLNEENLKTLKKGNQIDLVHTLTKVSNYNIFWTYKKLMATDIKVLVTIYIIFK